MPMPVSVTSIFRRHAAGFDGFLGQGARLLQADPHGDLAAVGEFDRIAHQVDQHLPQPFPVSDDDGRNARFYEIGQQQPLLVSPQSQPFHGLADLVGEVKRNRTEYELVGLHLGEVEQVVQDVQEGIGACLERLHTLTLRRREIVEKHEMRHAEHAIERGGIVADIGQEVRFRPAGGGGGLGSLFRMLQLAFETLNRVGLLQNQIAKVLLHR